LACNIIKQPAIDHQKELSKHKVMSTLWFQQSAEMEASYIQSYTWAKFLIDAKLDTMDKSIPKGVILDIDETVLDNSPNEARLIHSGKTFGSKTWKEWTDEARANALPGALDFTKYTMNKGVEVFYVSNRKTNELESTLINLKKLGFPNADSTHVLLMEDTGDKTKRRMLVQDQVRVILYVGDNLADYSEAFSDRGEDLGKDLVRSTAHEWLYEFVVLPNPTYGEWEKALYNNDYSVADSIKVKMRLKILQK
jgi:5'-nucleotidase (lipoprotein e(P4) family)